VIDTDALENNESQDERTDEELLRDIGEKDVSAMGALYDRYDSLAAAVAMRVLNDEEATEACLRDAFIAVWDRHDTFDPTRETVRIWLLSLVRNTAVDHQRGTARRTAEERPRNGGKPTTDAVPRFDARKVRDALNWLPSEQQSAIETAFFNGLNHHEIADSTNTPLGTVNDRMRLGLKRLRQTLKLQ
jgi:RNA polymerase sigma-70 factor, ECF subfamily